MQLSYNMYYVALIKVILCVISCNNYVLKGFRSKLAINNTICFFIMTGGIVLTSYDRTVIILTESKKTITDRLPKKIILNPLHYFSYMYNGFNKHKGEEMKETQTEKVTHYLFINGATDNKTIANDLGIISHNVRRITGQSTLLGDFERVSKGVYVLSESKLKEYQELYRKVS